MDVGKFLSYIFRAVTDLRHLYGCLHLENRDRKHLGEYPPCSDVEVTNHLRGEVDVKREGS